MSRDECVKQKLYDENVKLKKSLAKEKKRNSYLSRKIRTLKKEQEKQDEKSRRKRGKVETNTRLPKSLLDKREG